MLHNGVFACKKGYVGICFNDFHTQQLRNRLIDVVLKSFATPGDVLFEPAYASSMSSGDKVPTSIKIITQKSTSKETKDKKSDAKKDGETGGSESDGSQDSGKSG